MTRRYGSVGTVLGLFTLTLLLVWPALGLAGDNNTPGAGTDSSAIFRTYSGGAGFSFTSVSVSAHGNIIAFNSPAGAGNEHIRSGAFRSGYEVCYTVPGVGFFAFNDFGDTESAGWLALAISEPSGVGRFPLIIERTTPDGRARVLRRITGNSFVGPAFGGTYDTDFDGVGCGSLAECGNLGNRTIHVLTTVTNLTGGTLSGVAYQEVADFDISRSTDGSLGSASDIFVRTDDSVLAVDGTGSEDLRKGMLLQSLVLPALGDAFAFAGTPTGCSSTFGVATPTAPGDFEARVLMGFGDIPPFGGSTGSNFRVHYRRF
jgi:hypothetical protein